MAYCIQTQFSGSHGIHIIWVCIYMTSPLASCAVATYCCSSSGVHMDDTVYITPGSMDGSMEGKPSLVNTQLGATWADNLTLQIHTY